MTALPAAADPGRLTAALRRCGALEHGRVAEVAVERSFATVLSHIFRLRLAYVGAAPGAPVSLILKAGLAERPGGPWPAGRREVAFYREVAPATPPGLLPRCFEAAWEATAGTWHLLLEDLTDSHRVASRWPLPPAVADCMAIVAARAGFQAAWWDHPRLGDWGAPADDTDALDRLRAQYRAFADDLGDRLPVARRALYERLLAAPPGRGGPATILQGDAHAWNCLLPAGGGAGGARLFDWDAWQVGLPTDDLAYMMAVHWYPELRARIEARLLDRYHDALMEQDVRGYDRARLRDDYRRSVLRQALMPVRQHALGIPPVIWWNNLERVHLAVDDLDARALLPE